MIEAPIHSGQTVAKRIRSECGQGVSAKYTQLFLASLFP